MNTLFLICPMPGVSVGTIADEYAACVVRHLPTVDEDGNAMPVLETGPDDTAYVRSELKVDDNVHAYSEFREVMSVSR